MSRARARLDLLIFGDGFLSLERAPRILSKLSKRPASSIYPTDTPLLCAAEDAVGHQRTHGLLAHDGEEYDYRFLDRQQAAQLVELAGLRANSFRQPCSVRPISSHDKPRAV